MPKKNNQDASVPKLRQLVDSGIVETLLSAAEICDCAESLLNAKSYDDTLALLSPLMDAPNSSIREHVIQLATHAPDNLADTCHDWGDFEAELKCIEDWIRTDPKALYPQIRRAGNSMVGTEP